MPRPMFDSPFIFGLHDPGGEWIMAQAGRRGWILFTEEVGSDPNNLSGADYRPYSDQDFGVMVRINNGYGSVGTIPPPSRYAEFARRVANFVAASPGCRIWIIGNEMNHSQEWPELSPLRAVSPLSAALSAAEDTESVAPERAIGPTQDPFGRSSATRFSALSPEEVTPAGVLRSAMRSGRQPILPADYVRCFRLCRDAIRSLPGHSDDLVVIGAVAPWNAELTYPSNPTGDWIVYFTDILNGLGPDGLDGIALHTYTHGSDPALITDRSTMNPPFQNRYYNFQAYRNFMEAIPAPMRTLPVFITETDQDTPWLDANNGWVRAAYAEINRWNQQPGAQQIRSLLLYRWQRYDQWYIEGKNGVIEDFRMALANDYRWKQPPPKPAHYKVGDVVRTLTAVNLRAAPAGQIIGVAPPGTQATVRSVPYVMSGGLPFWSVRLLFNGQVRNGWLAQYTLDGVELLTLESFGSLRPAAFQQGDMARTLEVVNFRSHPAGPVISQLPRDAVVTILDPIFVMATGVPFWAVRAQVNGVPTDGWLAQYTQGGVVLLEGYLPVPQAEVEAPGATTAPVFAPGAEVRTTTLVRMRRTPGVANKPANDTIALVPAGATLQLVDGPRSADNMTWWRVRGELPDLGRVDGWMAQALPTGGPLLELVPPEPPKPPAIELPPGQQYAFAAGDRFRTTTIVRLRRSPGFVGKGAEDIVADIAPAIEGSIVAGPVEQDGLLWWQVQIVAQDGRIFSGWMAEATGDGEVLLQKIGAPLPPIGFRIGDLVQTTDFVNVRRTPGNVNKPPTDVQGALRPATNIVLLDGPRPADGLTWWRGGGIVTPPGVEVRGWVAAAVPGVGELLVRAPVLPGTIIPDPVGGVYLHPPFDGRYGIGQLWGENSAFYARYSYDGVPLLGHNGVDFSTPVGVSLQAVDDGVVLRADFEAGGFGYYLLIGHAWGESIYAHLSSFDVAAGQKVARGQTIGRSGNTGASTGPHLHFAIRINPYTRGDGWGGFRDPLPYLPPSSYTLPGYILDPAPSFGVAAAAPAPVAVRLAPSGMGDVSGEDRP
ncbi:MAG: M23 family metallopeptidase [Caldilinea sp.]|nr:M23 family metallopeptidase [Caldilinea sp.]